MLAATAVGLIAAPFALGALALADLARGRRKLPSVRVYLFALQYGGNDTAEILLAPLLWMRAGFGTRVGAHASIERHRRLQWWSLNLLARRAEQLLGIRIVVPDEQRVLLVPGPVVVIAPHTSLLDASLPALIAGREGLPIRGVVMAEMLSDPGFDLIYGRLGSVFIPRDDGAAARAAIRDMATAAQGDGDRAVIGIFPEGRLFRPAVRDRLLGKLTTGDPDRAARLTDLQHLLPPRPAGLWTTLMAMPTADVVVLDHRGLEQVASLTTLATAAPIERDIEVSIERIARASIPGVQHVGEPIANDELAGDDVPAEFIEWLDELWLDLDARRTAHR